jgi:hypothetical protein
VQFVSRAAACFGAIAVVLGAVAPVSAASTDSSTRLVIDEIRMPAQAQSRSVSLRAKSPCQDGAFKVLGGRQTSTYKWSFKASTTPSGLAKKKVTKILKRSFNNVTNARNDCGIPDNVSATHEYQGTTSTAPNCNSRDHKNVVGFGKLGAGVLAVTCYWINSGKIVEADMKITTRESWALSMASCHGNMPMLEATITHEAGHVFGLNHVGENKHGRLTMSPYLDGPCENGEATLGKGDVAGLESLY